MKHRYGHARSRSQHPDRIRPAPLSAIASLVVVGGNLRVSFQLPVVLRGPPKNLLVNAAPALSVIMLTPQLIEVVFASPVALGDTVVWFAGEPMIGTYSGGSIAPLSLVLAIPPDADSLLDDDGDPLLTDDGFALVL